MRQDTRRDMVVSMEFVVTQVAELIFIEEGDQFIPLQNIPVTIFIDSYKVTMLGNST